MGANLSGPSADILVLSIASQFLTSLEIPFCVKINTLGKLEERKNYLTELCKYFEEHESFLSADSRERISRGNPLRVLDSKDIGDRSLLSSAPTILNHLSKESMEHFEIVKEGLSTLDIPFTVDEKLVRGLDYYNDIVFEFTQAQPDLDNQSKDAQALGVSQDTILAGGRYDNLSSILGGPKMDAVGLVNNIPLIIQLHLNFFVLVGQQELKDYAFLLKKKKFQNHPDQFILFWPRH